ncbi:MAG: hypothetical protein ACE15C_00740 [Phycisphaerae bacterium]
MRKGLWCVLLCAAGLAILAGPALGQDRERRERRGGDDEAKAAREATPRERALEAQVRELTEQLKALKEALTKSTAGREGRPEARPFGREPERREAGPAKEPERREARPGPEGPGNILERMRERRQQEERGMAPKEGPGRPFTGPPGPFVGPGPMPGAPGGFGGPFGPREGFGRPQGPQPPQAPKAGAQGPFAGQQGPFGVVPRMAREGMERMREGMAQWGRQFMGRGPMAGQGLGMRQGPFGQWMQRQPYGQQRPGFGFQFGRGPALGPQGRPGAYDATAQAKALLEEAKGLIARAEQLLGGPARPGPRGPMVGAPFGRGVQERMAPRAPQPPAREQMGRGPFGGRGERGMTAGRPGRSAERGEGRFGRYRDRDDD